MFSYRLIGLWSVFVDACPGKQVQCCKINRIERFLLEFGVKKWTRPHRLIVDNNWEKSWNLWIMKSHNNKSGSNNYLHYEKLAQEPSTKLDIELDSNARSPKKGHLQSQDSLAVSQGGFNDMGSFQCRTERNPCNCPRLQATGVIRILSIDQS